MVAEPTTRCFALCIRNMAAATGSSGTTGFAIGSQTRWTRARRRLAREIRYRAWLQWIADEQWRRARREAAPVAIFGDFPFVVSGHSADVWARQHEFRLDASVGTPPDAFSRPGQDWGLPLYRWDVDRTERLRVAAAASPPLGRSL